MLDLHYFELPSRIPLAAATEGFADHKKIGSGGFGRVYVATVDRLPLTALLGSAPLSLFSFESRMSSRHVLSLFVVIQLFPSSRQPFIGAHTVPRSSHLRQMCGKAHLWR